MAARKCRWCEKFHQPRLLCDPAKRTLDALYARGMEFNMPTVEFPEAIPAEQLHPRLGLGPGDRLVQQFVVKAGVVEVAGVHRPVLVFTGQDPYGEVLPQWVYAGDDEEIGRIVALVTEVADMAVRRAAALREPA